MRRGAAAGMALAAVLASCGRGRTDTSGAYAEVVAAATPPIEKVTGLHYKHPPKLEVRSQAEFADFLRRTFAREMSATELAGTESAYKILGLLPDTLDLTKLMLSFLTEQAVGLYDPASKVLYVRADADPGQAGFIISHELVHALQDQYMNLDSISEQSEDNDRALAAHAVIEGQALLVPLQEAAGPKLDIESRLPGGWEGVRQMVRENFASTPVARSAPAIIREEQIFSYINGAEFVKEFLDHHPGQVPYGAAMPHSTEQILHSGAYFGAVRDEPLRVTLPPPRVGSARYENDLGELDTRILFSELLHDPRTAKRAAAGWGGDRFMVVATTAGDGLAWVTVWDTPTDAAEFASAMEDVIAGRFGEPKTARDADGALRYTTPKRAILLRRVQISGRPAVLYTDVPAGMSPEVIDVGAVSVAAER